MALKVSFGNGGNAKQTALTMEDPNYVGDDLGLNGGSVTSGQAQDGVGPVVPGESVPVSQVNVPNGGSGTGGSVDVAYNTASNAFEFDVSGAWNSVKNVLVESDTAANIVLNDFVHADVYFGGTGNSSVEIHNVKRGNIETGSGNDSVLVSLSTNDNSWQNLFDVDTGAGNDTITFRQGDQTGIAKTVDGRHTTVTIDAGAGSDVVDLSGLNLKLATINGGAGNDQFTGSNGKDTYVYNAIEGGNNGRDLITDFQVGTDSIQLGEGITATAFGTDIDLNLQVRLSDLSVITFQGVSALDAGSIFA
jgi:Ca2+-binding RTX toxin-like protein